MYLLGLGLLVLSTWYLLKLYDNFTNDQVAKKEINEFSEALKKDIQAKNIFAPGRIKDAIETYQKEMTNSSSSKDEFSKKESE
tara:strand:+ start:187 stop:435 length:249 start_codon:yes stop_codon:yes gene_type:complete